MMEKLWGDNFFDPTTKKWTKKHTGAASCKRGFVQFIYEPIKTIIDACMADNKVGGPDALQGNRALHRRRAILLLPGYVQHEEHCGQRPIGSVCAPLAWCHAGQQL